MTDPILDPPPIKPFNQSSLATMNPAFMSLLVLAVAEDLDEVRRLSPAEISTAANKAADEVSAGMDWLIRDNVLRSKAEREEFRKVWKGTVRAVAIASLVPGGIDLLGQHFDATEWPFGGKP